VTRIRTGHPGFNFHQRSSPPHRLRCTLILQSSEYWGPFPRDESNRNVKLITHLHLVLRLRMHGTGPSFTYTSSCRVF